MLGSRFRPAGAVPERRTGAPVNDPVRSRLAAEIAQDRSALLNIMASLGVTVRVYKVGAAWIGEKAGRLKFNGRLLARSPVSDLEELELLRLGVEGKAAGWRTLRTQADTEARLDAGRLDELIAGPGARPISSKNSGSAPQPASSAIHSRPAVAGPALARSCRSSP